MADPDCGICAAIGLRACSGCWNPFRPNESGSSFDFCSMCAPGAFGHVVYDDPEGGSERVAEQRGGTPGRRSLL